MASPNLTDTRASYKAVFALDICTAVIALGLLLLATKPTFKRLKARQLSTPRKSSDASGSASPLKTSLGTYLFLYPALLCFFLAYLAQIVSDVLRTSGTIDYGDNLQLSGRRPFSISGSGSREAIAALSFLTALATIFFTTLLNGGVWIHSDHVTSNGTGLGKPTLKSKIWNTFILLCILISGVAAWGRGLAVQDTSSSTVLTWTNAVHYDNPARIIYVVHQCIVILASLSVSVQVLRDYFTTNTNASGVSHTFLSRLQLANKLASRLNAPNYCASPRSSCR